MGDIVAAFEREFWATVQGSMRLCYMTRAKELQEAAFVHLGALSDRTCSLKQQAIADKDEDAANALLALESVADAFASESKMWVALKDDDADAAWTYLVGAQSAAARAMRAHEVGQRLDDYTQRLDVLEQVLFPPQMFRSIGIRILRSSCSICGREYDSCDHIKGRAYMGQMCVRVIDKSELLEVSVVTDPANKHCRAISITDESGVKRNVMTWRVEPADKDAQPT